MQTTDVCQKDLIRTWDYWNISIGMIATDTVLTKGTQSSFTECRVLRVSFAGTTLRCEKLTLRRYSSRAVLLLHALPKPLRHSAWSHSLANDFRQTM